MGFPLWRPTVNNFFLFRFFFLRSKNQPNEKLERGNFGNLNRFISPLTARYGNSSNVEDFTEKSQVQVYEGHRAYFEAYSRNKYFATGVVQWMQNNAQPQMLWRLYDFYFTPSASYFAVKKACANLSVLFSYDEYRSIYLVNSLYKVWKEDLTVTAKVYNCTQSFNPVFSETHQVRAPFSSDSSNFLFTLPAFRNVESSHFLVLKVFSSKDNKLVADNFYWLSTKPDVLAWKNSTWYNTPAESFADFSLLQKIPRVKVESRTKLLSVSPSILVEGATQVKMEITTCNPSSSTIAFFVRLRIVDAATKQDILPVFFTDNYFSLEPRETKVVEATYNTFQTADKLLAEIITETFNEISGGK